MIAVLVALILVLGPFLVLFLAVDGPPRNRSAADPPAPGRSRRSAPVVVVDDELPVVLPTPEEVRRRQAESRLARQRLAGEIDRAAYRDAMADLAARDAHSGPLRMPGGSAG